MKKQNKKLLTLMLAGLCTVSLGASVATANASADEATTVTASTYAISEVFAGSGTAGEDAGSVAFTLGNDQDMRMKRDLAFKWYEAKGEAKYLTIKFAFKELNFTSVTFKVESASSVATKDKKTTNSVKFAVKDGEVYASVIHGTGDDAKEGDAVKVDVANGVTLALAEGSKFDTFAVNVNETAIGEFINVGANYSDYPLEIKAATEGEAKAVIFLKEINNQLFAGETATGVAVVKDGKVTDTAAPVLVVNEDVNGFQIGTAFALDYEKIDVLQTSSLSESKKYYQYNPADTDVSYNTSLTTSTYFMDTVYYVKEEDGALKYSATEQEGYVATSVMFEEGREYVSIQVTLGDSTYNDTKDSSGNVPYAKVTYDLSWYASAEAVATVKEKDYIIIDDNDEGATYSYITLNNDEAKNERDEDSMKAQKANYEYLLAETAKDTYAGSNSDFVIPAVDWLIKDNGGYRNLKFTISYKTPSSSSPKTASSLSYNALDISVTEEGLYEFKIFANDKAGNTMKYYLDGKLVDVTTSNVWEIEEIPSFTFEIANKGIKVEEASSSTARKAEKILDETYTLSGLTVIGATNQQSAYALYRLDTTGYKGATITPTALTSIKYEDIRSAAALLLGKVGTEEYPTYFDLYLDIYAEKVAAAIGGDKDAVKACFKEIKAYNANITENDPEWEEYNKYNWNASSKSFKTVEEGEYLILADFWEKELPMQRASAYKVVIVETEEDVAEGESKVLAWMRNNKVSVILFGVAAVMLILIIVLLLVKPSEETLEDVDKEVEKKDKKDEE